MLLLLPFPGHTHTVVGKRAYSDPVNHPEQTEYRLKTKSAASRGSKPTDIRKERLSPYGKSPVAFVAPPWGGGGGQTQQELPYSPSSNGHVIVPREEERREKPDALHLHVPPNKIELKKVFVLRKCGPDPRPPNLGSFGVGRRKCSFDIILYIRAAGCRLERSPPTPHFFLSFSGQ